MDTKNKLEELLQQFNSDASVAKEIKATARELVLESKDESLRLKSEAEAQIAEVNKKHEEILNLRARLDERIKELSDTREQEIAALEKFANLSRDEAENKLFEILDKQLVEEQAKRIKDNESIIQAESDKRARDILITTMQRIGTENVAEYTIYTIDLPSEDLKGRIIGKDGRNIKSFEDASGVSVEIGEQGEPTVAVSSFDPVKREIARIAMERLVADGRIQPSRIEEMLKQANDDVDKIVVEAGNDAMYRAGVTNLPEEVVKLLGRLKFRTSYGQNMIEHSLEVVKIGVAVAAEVGANTDVVRQACLLHDIGKAVSAETDEGHAEVGAEICRRYGVSDEVVVAFEDHHKHNFKSQEAVVMYIADAISGARPGARKEDYEGYVAHVKELESIADSFKGVERSFAIQAGREVRVLVKPAEITDAEMMKLAHDISRKIHEQVANFPAPIKVTVIRETVATAVAKPNNG